MATVKDVAASLITDRLALRRLTSEDLDLLDRLHSDPVVTRYVGGVKTRAQTEAMLKTRILEYYEKFPGLGVWATIERASGACIGIHLLNHIQGESYIQVGYVLFSPYWGRGYATEMTVALLRYGFGELGLPAIFAITDLPNVASQRVLLKAGLERKGERSFAHPAYAASGLLAWFEGEAERWLASHPE
ncbi:MAG TPA: GNAT family N-acetyltransferase [Polyangiaceae bacterium]|nr:GNAT family N-acetyltransferase [Polyangiaceae bacterium]